MTIQLWVLQLNLHHKKKIQYSGFTVPAFPEIPDPTWNRNKNTAELITIFETGTGK